MTELQHDLTEKDNGMEVSHQHNNPPRSHKMHSAFGPNAIVRVIENWPCPCGKRTMSAHDFDRDPKSGDVRATCQLCHQDLVAVERI
jgi:hypothetical protein